VKIAYAFRRESWYPHFGPRGTELVPADLRPAWLKKVKSLGFDGLEISAVLPDGGDANESAVGELRRQLEGAGLPVLGVRGGGGLAKPQQILLARAGKRRFSSLRGLDHPPSTETCVRRAIPTGPGIMSATRCRRAAAGRPGRTTLSARPRSFSPSPTGRPTSALASLWRCISTASSTPPGGQRSSWR